MTDAITEATKVTPPVKPALGVIIGRFQPFHNGHMKLITTALQECTKVLVVIGSANSAGNYKNPLSSIERRDILDKTFPKKLSILPVDDFPLDSEWVQEVTGYINSFEEDPTKVMLYTGTKDAEFYRNNFIYRVEDLGIGVSATDIRKELYREGTIKSQDLPSASVVSLTKFLGTDEYPRLRNEYDYCTARYAEATLAHRYNNPIELVAHAMVIHKGNILLVKRAGIRGHGQLALPGGFVESTESTRVAALRELYEEVGLDLRTLKAKEVAFANEENLGGLSVRTFGVNYAYYVDPEENVDLTINDSEVLGVEWVPLSQVVKGKTPLFYNHLTVIRRLTSKISENNENTRLRELANTKGVTNG